MKNNLRLLTVVIGIALVSPVMAQKDNVGIGTTKPDQSAALDISSSTKGLLMPRMTMQQRSLIQKPAQGLVIYQTDFLSGFYFYDGLEWNAMNSQNSIAGTDGDWSLIGNAGTTPSTNFVGTTDNVPLVFKTNNQFAGYIQPSGKINTFFGHQSGNSLIGMLNAGSPTAGELNVGVGYRTLFTNTIGSFNLAFGTLVMESNTAGSYNTGIGSLTLRNNIDGSYNLALGLSSLQNNNSGAYNIGIGAFTSLYNTTGQKNIAIGHNALYHNQTASNNIGIGFEAGFLKRGSGNVYIGSGAGSVPDGITITPEENKLYIANSNTTTPLIKGDFANNNLKFHLGTTSPTPTTGYLAIGDFATAAGTTGGAGGLGIPAMATASDKYRLIVQDGILTERLKVALRNSTDWADYVFDKSYKLMPLEKVEAYVKANKHLPNVPSAEEMAATGIDMQKTSTKFMEKIEELTLYMIEMNKEIKALKAENERLKKK